MNILVLHQNFPGQFRRLVPHLAAAGQQVLGVGAHSAPGLPNIPLLRYRIDKPAEAGHRYLGVVTRAVQHGEVVARALLGLKQKGYRPDVVLAHPGWGEALYVKDVFPQARLVSLFEFYYRLHGSDVGFDPASPVTFDSAGMVTARNLLHLMNLERCDAGVSPTRWQRDQHPETYRHKITVAHEGVDTETMRPEPAAAVNLPDGRTLRPGDAVLTYVARNLEPYRGFHVFMRALPEILRRNPQALVVVVGGDRVSYGRAPEGAPNWREKLLAEVGAELDMSRVIFPGLVPYHVYRGLLRVSAAHVYLTYPFVLSWSMLEAMSCGCLVLGSATPPVQEVLRHGENGLLFDFFDTAALAELATQALSRPQDFAPLRQAARQTILDGYSLEQGIASYTALLNA